MSHIIIWIIALILLVPTYGVSILVAIVLSMVINKTSSSGFSGGSMEYKLNQAYLAFCKAEYGETATSGYVRTFIMMLLLIIGIINRKKLTVLDENWIKLFFVALCLQPIAQFNPALFRINYYFYFFIILLAILSEVVTDNNISNFSLRDI